MIYDITNENSFKELKNFWYQKVKDNTKNIILGIIANKSDLYENEVIPIEDGKKFALQCNAFFYESCAKEYDITRQMFLIAINKFIETYGNDLVKNENNVISVDSSQKKDKSRCC